MPTVARLNVTPVKSTMLHHPERIRLERHGAAGNRDFLFVDEHGGRFSGSKKVPLLQIRAEYEDERDRIELRLPDGVVVAGEAAAVGEALVVDFYGRPVPAHVVEGDFTEALSRFAGSPMRLARVDEPGAGTDVRPVTLMSLASVEELSRQGGREEPVDSRRFRMLLEIDGCRPHEEDTWTGRHAQIGEAVVLVGDQVPRCVVTTLDPDTGVRDFPTLSLIRKYRGMTENDELPFGVYGDVVRPGIVRIGDPVDVLD